MKPINYLAAFAIVLIISPLLLGSCEKDNDTIPQTTTDFRDEYIGDYNCMRVHLNSYTDTSGWIQHIYDTTWNVIVNVGYHTNDSSILVTPGGDGEQAYIGNYTFECVICSGPEGYTRFFAPDSIYIYQRIGVNSYNRYYGHKAN